MFDNLCGLKRQLGHAGGYNKPPIVSLKLCVETARHRSKEPCFIAARRQNGREIGFGGLGEGDGFSPILRKKPAMIRDLVKYLSWFKLAQQVIRDGGDGGPHADARH